MNTKSPRCNSCILPRSAHHLDFDRQGTCSLCNAARVNIARKNPEIREYELNECIRKMKELGKGKQFDCVVGVSGGRDSSYLLYLLVNNHNLRCLAAYYQTPFTPNLIDSNVRKIVKKLNVPLVEMNISTEFHRRVTREIVILWKNQPIPILANLACAPCKLLNREAFKIAGKNDVKSIVYGGSPYENFQLGPASVKRLLKTQKRHSFKAMFIEALVNTKKGIGLLVKHINLCRYIPIGFQAAMMYRNPHTNFLRLRYPDIYCIDYFHYGEWNEFELEKVLLELGWELPPECNTTWRADCSFAELKNYMFYRTTGVTPIDALFANMVRSGVLSRDEALRRIEVEGKTSKERLAEVLSILELPSEFFSFQNSFMNDFF